LFSERAPNSVLVVSPSEKITELLNEVLPGGTFSPVVTVSSCGEAKRALLSADYDIIVVNTPLADEFGSEFALDIVAQSSAVALLLVKNEIYEQVSSGVENFGVMTLPKPLSRSTLYSAMKIAVATRARLRTMDRKNRSLSSKMDDIRLVNRAKWALIENLGMTEEQAHRYIEKQAMDMRRSKREIAENLIKTYEK
jgi:response regulator NasT